jgi:hypothetical protein
METPLAADEPKTDREWLILISKDVKILFRKLEDICDKQTDSQRKIETQQTQIDELKKQRIIQTFLLIGLIILIGGRYVFGPTSIPLVP